MTATAERSPELDNPHVRAGRRVGLKRGRVRVGERLSPSLRERPEGGPGTLESAPTVGQVATTACCCMATACANSTPSWFSISFMTAVSDSVCMHR